jgi:hypothetical protein
VGKSTKGLESELEILESSKSEFQEVLNEFTSLENSTQVYNIVTNAVLKEGTGGKIEFNKETKHVDVMVGSTLDLLESLPHELKHAYQFEIRKVSLGYYGGGGALYDLQDEVEAYQRSKMFGYHSGKIIDADWVLATGGYRNISKKRTQLTMETYISIGSKISLGEQLKSSINQAGRNCTPPNDVCKDWQIYHSMGENGQSYTPVTR